MKEDRADQKTSYRKCCWKC